MKIIPTIYKNSGCHPKEYEAEALDLISGVCGKCGAVLMSANGVRAQRDQYAEWLNKIPNWVKRMFI